MITKMSLHLPHVMLEEHPDQRLEGDEGYEFYEYRFQLMSPYKFSEDLDAKGIAKMFREAKNENKELVQLTENDIFSRLVRFINYNYPPKDESEDGDDGIIGTK